MRCEYCYAPPKPDPGMSFETGKQAIDLGGKLSDGSCGIVFFGGEPLLKRPLIYDLVHYARDCEAQGKGMYHFKITTNGVLLDREFLAFSINYNVLVAMSFDGIQPAHDAHRKMADGKSSFEFLLPRLKLLLKARPYASILMVVNPDTAQYLSESVSFLINLGVRYLICSLNFDAQWTEKSFSVLKKQFNKVAEQYADWTQEGRKFYFSPFEVKLSSHINQHDYKKERCELAKSQISVDSEGYLFPCVQFVKAGKDSEWCIGNVTGGIDEARRHTIRMQSDAEKAFCESCAIKNRCNNTCGCLNWQTMDTINEVSPVLCRYEQMLVPIADRIGKILYKKRNPHFLHKHYNAAYPVLSLLEEAGENKSGRT